MALYAQNTKAEIQIGDNVELPGGFPLIEYNGTKGNWTLNSPYRAVLTAIITGKRRVEIAQFDLVRGNTVMGTALALFDDFARAAFTNAREEALRHAIYYEDMQ